MKSIKSCLLDTECKDDYKRQLMDVDDHDFDFFMGCRM